MGDLMTSQRKAKSPKSTQEKEQEAKEQKELEELAKTDPEAAKELAAQRAKEKAEMEADGGEDKVSLDDMTPQEQFHSMVSKLGSLVDNWDSAVKSPPPE